MAEFEILEHLFSPAVLGQSGIGQPPVWKWYGLQRIELDLADIFSCIGRYKCRHQHILGIRTVTLKILTQDDAILIDEVSVRIRIQLIELL